jgi:homopolymeric O-antigen transport system permease protein
MVSGSPTARPSSPAEIVIRPQSGWAPLHSRELWGARELVGFFAWRDMNVRYRKTAIGILWAILQPFLTLNVFSIVFGRLAHGT